VGKFQLIVYI